MTTSWPRYSTSTMAGGVPVQVSVPALLKNGGDPDVNFTFLSSQCSISSGEGMRASIERGYEKAQFDPGISIVDSPGLCAPYVAARLDAVAPLFLPVAALHPRPHLRVTFAREYENGRGSQALESSEATMQLPIAGCEVEIRVVLDSGIKGTIFATCTYHYDDETQFELSATLEHGADIQRWARRAARRCKAAVKHHFRAEAALARLGVTVRD